MSNKVIDCLCLNIAEIEMRALKYVRLGDMIHICSRHLLMTNDRVSTIRTICIILKKGRV